MTPISFRHRKIRFLAMPLGSNFEPPRTIGNGKGVLLFEKSPRKNAPHLFTKRFFYGYQTAVYFKGLRLQTKDGPLCSLPLPLPQTINFFHRSDTVKLTVTARRIPVVGTVTAKKVIQFTQIHSTYLFSSCDRNFFAKSFRTYFVRIFLAKNY